MPGGERVRVVAGTAGEAEHVAVGRIEHDGGAVEARSAAEAVLDRLLHVVVDRQLQALAFGRLRPRRACGSRAPRC